MAVIKKKSFLKGNTSLALISKSIMTYVRLSGTRYQKFAVGTFQSKAKSSFHYLNLRKLGEEKQQP